MDAVCALANENIRILEQAETLLNNLSDEIYANNDILPYQSGVGKHIRHILDFYRAFLSAPDNTVDYDRRERSEALETDRMHAAGTIRQVIQTLETVDDADRAMLSKNDDGGHRRADHAFSRSSVGRELQFLASHTVHHFAMVAMILVMQGHTPPKDFGVAASTLAYWRWRESGRQDPS